MMDGRQGGGGSGGRGHAFQAGASLGWTRPRWLAPRWELADTRGTIASFERLSLLGRRWSLVAGDRRLVVEAGWFGGAELREAGDSTLVASFKPGWLGRGRIVLAGGGTLHWRHHWLSIWQPGLEIADEGGSPLVRYEWRPTQGRFRGTISIESPALRRDDLEALVLLGWALTLLSFRQSNSGGA